jgi:glucose/arabinose dehydrogenase
MNATSMQRPRQGRGRSLGRHCSGLASVAVIALLTAPGAALAVEAPFERDPEAAPGEAGLQLPEGFVAEVVHEGVGRARHIAVRDNGDLYVRLREAHEDGGIAALRDESGDGRFDRVEYFADHEGTGIRIHDGYLYASSNTELYRWELNDELVPDGEGELVIGGFPEQEGHAAKAFAIDRDQNRIYVNVGAPSNACEHPIRTASPGQEPCPELERQAALWAFDLDATEQDFEADGERFVTGVRNVVAIDWNEGDGNVYFVQHGRDQLHEFWPEHYTPEQNAELPAEEFHVAREGADYGWPYTYWNHHRGERMVAPEYGGDGETAAANEFEEPLIAFPAHFAPNGLLFYHGEQFPEEFRGGAFIAWHGSWDRAPFEQRGYKVTFAPFENGEPTGEWYVFADDFAGVEVIETRDDAEYRPMGLAMGPDGALYISDSQVGRIWRVTYEG